MSDEYADLEAIRAARAREQHSSTLIQLADPTVFERAQDAIDAGEIDTETAVELATELADERAGKLLKLASFEAAGMAVDWDGATDSERKLVEDLAARIETWRDGVIPDA
jgi:DNA replication initiation complex subunit (GINS family)